MRDYLIWIDLKVYFFTLWKEYVVKIDIEIASI